MKKTICNKGKQILVLNRQLPFAVQPSDFPRKPRRNPNPNTIRFPWHVHLFSEMHLQTVGVYFWVPWRKPRQQTPQKPKPNRGQTTQNDGQSHTLNININIKENTREPSKNCSIKGIFCEIPKGKQNARQTTIGQRQDTRYKTLVFVLIVNCSGHVPIPVSVRVPVPVPCALYTSTECAKV